MQDNSLRARFRDSRRWFLAGEHFERMSSTKVGTLEKLWWEIKHVESFARFAFVLPVICSLRGHVLRDADQGDPEVGPQPQVHCTRCFREW